MIALDRHAAKPSIQPLRLGLAHLALHRDPFVRDILLAAELPDAGCAQTLCDLTLKGVASCACRAASATALGVLTVNVQLTVLAHFQHPRCAHEYEVVLPLL